MSDDLHLDMKVLQWRDLVRQGKGHEITRDEMKAAVAALRGERAKAQTIKESAPVKAKKTTAATNAQGLLDDFLSQSGGDKSLKLPDPE